MVLYNIFEIFFWLMFKYFSETIENEKYSFLVRLDLKCQIVIFDKSKEVWIKFKLINTAFSISTRWFFEAQSNCDFNLLTNSIR